jgi:hypothetical protein
MDVGFCAHIFGYGYGGSPGKGSFLFPGAGRSTGFTAQGNKELEHKHTCQQKEPHRANLPNNEGTGKQV